MAVVAFVNQKGGVGKTTLAFNTAHALCSMGKRVLCIDLDPQANLSYLLTQNSSEESPGEGIYQLLVNSCRELKHWHHPVTLFDCIGQCDLGKTLEGQGQLDFIMAGSDLSGLELTVANMRGPRQLLLNTFLDKSGPRKHYDYILLDAPPTLGLIVVNIMCASDGLVVPFRPDQFSKLGLLAFQEVINEVRDMGIGHVPEVWGLVPNLVESRRKQEQSDLLSMRALLEKNWGKILMPDLPNRAALGKALAKGKSVFEFQSQEFYYYQECFRKMAEKLEQKRALL